ncbi:MAG: hypothetical protein OHK0039_28720 [Bacteroidia bacterium]
MSHDELFDTLAAYRAGDLDPDEQAEAERLLREDPRAAEAWSELLAIESGLRAFGNRELRTRLQTIHEANHPTRVVSLVSRRWILGVSLAAALALLLLFAPWQARRSNFHLQHRAESSPAQPHELRELAEALARQRPDYLDGTSPQGQTYLRQLSTGAYQPVIDALGGRAAAANDAEALALGIAYLQAGDATRALPYLQALHARGSSRVMADWYLSLAYILDNQVEQARPLLENLYASQPTHPRRQVAGQLLERFPPKEFE